MSRTLLVVERPADWAPYYPSDRVITFADYLATQETGGQRTRVINLCRSYRYLSDGYYCSLLAEARGHHVIPSVRTLNELGRRDLFELQLEGLDKALDKAVADHGGEFNELVLRSFFGTTSDPSCRELARQLFERFPCPVLEIRLKRKRHWKITDLRPVSHRHLDEMEEDTFARALDEFSRKVWRESRRRKQWRYDLAILVDPEERMPPSDAGALRRFIRAGRRLGIDVELIGRRDYVRVAEFDGLFIRETTAIDHHTYRFATRAEREGLVVVDDPVSILRCTNKIFLADQFRAQGVPAPRTWLLHKGNGSQLDDLDAAGYPLVLKIPDGSFSRGVSKVKSREELEKAVETLFKRSSLLLAQEYIYTDFDWRIGIFNNQALYACRYFMVRDHWQIYRHDGQKKSDSGGFEALPVEEVPQQVLDAALASARGIGNGFYGVDVKERDGKAYVIEVNDNPSIESGVEDQYLGEKLYEQIMGEFLRRMEAKRAAAPATGSARAGARVARDAGTPDPS